MEDRPAQRCLCHPGRERGFTLIELMVVVLIIAILVAIAVPTFLGQRRSATNRGTQTDLRNALTTATSYYAGATFYTADLDELSAIEPNLFKRNGTDASDDPVVARVPAGFQPQQVCLSSEGADGEWFAVYEDATSMTRFGRKAGADPFTNCTAAEAVGFASNAGDGWGS